jgi:hypothetical protein
MVVLNGEVRPHRVQWYCFGAPGVTRTSKNCITPISDASAAKMMKKSSCSFNYIIYENPTFTLKTVM